MYCKTYDFLKTHPTDCATRFPLSEDTTSKLVIIRLLDAVDVTAHLSAVKKAEHLAEPKLVRETLGIRWTLCKLGG